MGRKMEYRRRTSRSLELVVVIVEDLVVVADFDVAGEPAAGREVRCFEPAGRLVVGHQGAAWCPAYQRRFQSYSA